jgi:hypothetical protein
MARRRRQSEGERLRTEVAKSRWVTHEPGESYRPYGLFQELGPDSPPTAYYFRRYQTLRDSLLAMKVSEKRAEPQDQGLWRDASEATLKDLGSTPPDYAAARAAIRKWFQSASRRSGDQEPSPGHVADAIDNLISAYQDPKRFFCEIAPREFPAWFDGYLANEMLVALANLASSGLPPSAIDARFPARLGQAIWAWGVGALDNPGIRAAWDAAPAALKNEIISRAQGREVYSEGRRKGSADRKPRKRRVNAEATAADVDRISVALKERYGFSRGTVNLAIRGLAKKEGKSPEAIRKRRRRARKPKK